MQLGPRGDDENLRRSSPVHRGSKAVASAALVVALVAFACTSEGDAPEGGASPDEQPLALSLRANGDHDWALEGLGLDGDDRDDLRHILETNAADIPDLPDDLQAVR